MKNKSKICLLLVTGILAVSGGSVSFGNIANTKHNLSASGPGAIKATSGKNRICIFCHTPHGARKDIPFLWNRSNPIVQYTPYFSTTLKALVGQPTGASKMCLSCHDGTIALGAVISEPQEIPFAGGIRFMPDGDTKLGTDLSDDHPISFVYDGNLARQNTELADPASLPDAVRLAMNDQEQGQLQCTACHNPHDDKNGMFLVMSNRNSALCITCHIKTGWTRSSHAKSIATWNGNGTDPWPNTQYTTVSENGCENCHRPHTAGANQRLLKYAPEEDNCLICHNGTVASTDIESELTNSYTHPVGDYIGDHDASEDPASFPKHVECEDCHNPHQITDAVSPGPPHVSGANKGVKGITAGGQAVADAQFQYEICFKCHADNNVLANIPIARQINQRNTRLEFDPGNPSFHPVASQGVNSDVPSLISPYTTSSIIFCTDCHNTDNTTGPKGPHGSMNEYLLEQNYETADYTRENSSSYAMCYKCHSRSSILNDESFAKHKKHIQDKDTPCSVCHDSHGVSNTQGNAFNNSHLINFDVSVVQPDSNGRLYFEDLGNRSGRCYLDCHGKDHRPKGYGSGGGHQK